MNVLLTFIARMELIGGILIAIGLGLIVVTLVSPFDAIGLAALIGLAGAVTMALGYVSKDSLIPYTRRPLFRGFAKRYGFEYVGHDPTVDALPFTARSRVLDTNYWIRAHRSHVTSGDWRGAGAHVFWMQWDQREWKETYDPTQRIRTAICAALSTNASVPHIQLDPATLVSRVGRRVGMQDIEVGFEPFDRAFRVRAHDADAAREFLVAEMQNWLLNAPSDIHYEIADGWILARCRELRAGRTVDRLAGLLDAATGIRERIPERWTEGQESKR